VAVVAVVAWSALFTKSNLEKGRLALNDAYRQGRPIEARVSDLSYAPYQPTRGESGKVNSLERERAESLLSEAFSQNPNADTHHALGQMYLLQRQPDKAIEHLEQAKKADSNNPSIYADLGAAYLEKGKLGAPEALRLSLDNLQRALELKPNLDQALFNRALVHQYQDQNDQAEADWRAYLERDASSQWATEARENLRLLEERKR
jgi:tetratricopeptide (TPR) repeat protein